MKLKFVDKQFQTDAVNAVANLFKGQEKSAASFSITTDPNIFAFMQNDYGFGNAKLIDAETPSNGGTVRNSLRTRTF